MYGEQITGIEWLGQTARSSTAMNIKALRDKLVKQNPQTSNKTMEYTFKNSGCTNLHLS